MQEIDWVEIRPISLEEIRQEFWVEDAIQGDFLHNFHCGGPEELEEFLSFFLLLVDVFVRVRLVEAFDRQIGEVN